MEPNLSPTQVKERITHLEETLKQLQSELAAWRSRQLVEALIQTDGPLPRENSTVIRTERGLTVKGTRLTLYALMDEIKGNNSLKNIRDIYELTDAEMLDILDYIHLHRVEVEAEYQEVVRASDEARQYWETRNRGQLAETYPQREVVRAKLREWREQYQTESKA